MRELTMTVIHPAHAVRRTVAPRIAARHEAQCQIPSHCVAHSWQSLFLQFMQTAYAGRCAWKEQYWMAGVGMVSWRASSLSVERRNVEC